MKSENSNNPFIAIWMVSYNQEEFISQAIESVVMQNTNFDFKLYIGEDFSTDNTREICTALKIKHPEKIELFFNEKKIGATANGIQMYKKCYATNAKYIALCEGDDYWTDPLKLQKQVDFLEANTNYAGCFHNTLVKYENQTTKQHLFRDELKPFYTAEDSLSAYTLFHTSSFLFRKEALFFPEWFNQIVLGDICLFSIIAKSGKLGKVDGVMSVYRKHERGLTNTNFVIDNFFRHKIILLPYLNSFHDYKYNNSLNQNVTQLINDYTSIKLRKLKEEITSSDNFLKEQISFKRLILAVLNKLKKRIFNM
jgi:glycosyltransferase involved in cell wall biosynthesis